MTITSGDLDTGGRANPVRFPGSFLDEEDKSPTRALNLMKNVSDGSVDGTVKMIVSDEKIENSHKIPYFIMSEGQIVGAVKLGHAFDITESDYDLMKGLHGLPEGGCPEGGAYGYRIKAIESFEELVKVKTEQNGLVVDVEAYLPNNVIKMMPVQKSTEERIVASAVLVPGVTDLHDEIYDEEVVRAAAYYFLEHYMMDDDHGIDVMHDGEIVPEAIRPVQSFVLDEERTYDVEVPALDDDHPAKEMKTLTFPKGTWIMYARIISDTLWGKVKTGDYKSWSIAGLARVVELRKILGRAA